MIPPTVPEQEIDEFVQEFSNVDYAGDDVKMKAALIAIVGKIAAERDAAVESAYARVRLETWALRAQLALAEKQVTILRTAITEACDEHMECQLDCQPKPPTGGPCTARA